MTTLRENPVAYWTECAKAHRVYAATFGKTPGQLQLHEELAVECEMKAAEAAAKRAFVGP